MRPAPRGAHPTVRTSLPAPHGLPLPRTPRRWLLVRALAPLATSSALHTPCPVPCDSWYRAPRSTSRVPPLTLRAPRSVQGLEDSGSGQRRWTLSVHELLSRCVNSGGFTAI